MRRLKIETNIIPKIMKKQYIAPKFKVVEIKEADIICTSDTVSAFSIEENAGYSEEDW